ESLDADATADAPESEQDEAIEKESAQEEAPATRSEATDEFWEEVGVDPIKLARSEEHTSELQSRENLVCRLLLEKKKNNDILLTRIELVLERTPVYRKQLTTRLGSSITEVLMPNNMQQLHRYWPI